MDEAGDLARLERKRLSMEMKPDGSLVTQADKAIEKFMIPRLQAIYPAAIVGEEGGVQGELDGAVWLIDPIDGTSNFWFDVPFWGISAGLQVDGRLVAGAISLPDLDEVYIGQLGHGATCNGKALEPLRGGPLLKHELIGYSSPEVLFSHGRILGGKMRHFGALVAEGMMIASGRMRAMTVGRASLYDAAAAIVILRELGAEFWDYNLVPLDPNSQPVVGRLTPFLICAPGAFENGARERMSQSGLG